MKYKIIYCKIVKDMYGDIYSETMTPFIVDARYEKTQEHLVEALKEYIVKKFRQLVENFYEQEDIPDDEYRTNPYGIPNWSDEEKLDKINYQWFMHEKLLQFNADNNIKVLADGYWSDDINEIYLRATIFETTPELIKSDESDCMPLIGSPIVEDNYIANDVFQDFKIKGYMFASNFVATEDYESDERWMLGETYKSISKNGLALFLAEQSDYMKILEAFYKQVYSNYNDNEDWEQYLHISKTSIDKYIADKRSFVRWSAYSAEDDNGFSLALRFRYLPIVSYYKEGETAQCGEK